MKLKLFRTSSILMILGLSLVLSLGLLLGQFVFTEPSSYAASQETDLTGVTVKVKAAGNANYKASAVKAVTFKVKIK